MNSRVSVRDLMRDDLPQDLPERLETNIQDFFACRVEDAAFAKVIRARMGRGISRRLRLWRSTSRSIRKAGLFKSFSNVVRPSRRTRLK